MADFNAAKLQCGSKEQLKAFIDTNKDGKLDSTEINNFKSIFQKAQFSGIQIGDKDYNVIFGDKKRITGTKDNEIIFGNAKNNVIKGNGGNDIIFGSEGQNNVKTNRTLPGKIFDFFTKPVPAKNQTGQSVGESTKQTVGDKYEQKINQFNDFTSSTENYSNLINNGKNAEMQLVDYDKNDPNKVEKYKSDLLKTAHSFNAKYDTDKKDGVSQKEFSDHEIASYEKMFGQKLSDSEKLMLTEQNAKIYGNMDLDGNGSVDDKESAALLAKMDGTGGEIDGKINYQATQTAVSDDPSTKKATQEYYDFIFGKDKTNVAATDKTKVESSFDKKQSSTHKIETGETLYEIVADRYGLTEKNEILNKCKEIATLNGLKDIDTIIAGKDLKFD